MFSLLLINGTDFAKNWAMAGFMPYIAMFGTAFWGLLLGILGMGIWIGSSKNNLMTAVYLMCVDFFFGAVIATNSLGLALVVIFASIAGFVISFGLYDRFIEQRTG